MAIEKFDSNLAIALVSDNEYNLMMLLPNKLLNIKWVIDEAMNAWVERDYSVIANIVHETMDCV